MRLGVIKLEACVIGHIFIKCKSSLFSYVTVENCPLSIEDLRKKMYFSHSRDVNRSLTTFIIIIMTRNFVCPYRYSFVKQNSFPKKNCYQQESHLITSIYRRAVKVLLSMGSKSDVLFS